jgi:hypothetical protein
MDLRRWNVGHVRMVLQAAPAFAPFPPRGTAQIADIRAKVGDAAIAQLLGKAEADMVAPIPALPAELYLDFQRTGRREGYEDAQRQRRNMLYRLTLAEWLEGNGRHREYRLGTLRGNQLGLAGACPHPRSAGSADPGPGCRHDRA